MEDFNLEYFLEYESDERILNFLKDMVIEVSDEVPIYGSDNTYLHLLLGFERFSVIDKIEGDIDLDIPSPLSGKTPLQIASQDMRIETIKYLIKKGSIITKSFPSYHSFIKVLLNPIGIYVYDKNLRSIFELFFERGVDVNLKDEDGNTFLILISRLYHPISTSFLLEKGIDINAINNEGYNAFINSCFNDRYTTEVLIQNEKLEVKWEENPIYYYNALSMQCRLGTDKIIKFLLERGMDPDGDGSYLSPIIIALKYNYYSTVKLLLEYGASVGRDEDGNLILPYPTDLRMKEVFEDNFRKLGNKKGVGRG